MLTGFGSISRLATFEPQVINVIKEKKKKNTQIDHQQGSKNRKGHIILLAFSQSTRGRISLPNVWHMYKLR